MTKTTLAVSLNTFIFLLLTYIINPTALAASKAPVFELPGDTESVSLEKYRNQVVYIDFWASWCTPCVHAFPWLNQMQERYGNDGFKVIGINVDKDKAKAKKFLEHVPATFDIAYDPEGKVADLYSLKVMPSSYLIDREGNLVHSHKGFKTSDGSRMEDIIRKLLDDK
jgi:thiol-disulfide isomerase/thioredoxin